MSNRHNRAKGLPAGLRWRIFARDNFTCRYCGAAPPDVVLHVDHVTARANGGGDDESNLVTACESCNIGKSHKELQPVKQAFTKPEQAMAIALAARDEFPEAAGLFLVSSIHQLERMKEKGIPFQAASLALITAALRTAAELWHSVDLPVKSKRQFMKLCSASHDEEQNDKRPKGGS